MKKVVLALGVAALVVFALCIGLQIAGGPEKVVGSFPEDEGPASKHASVAPSASARPGTIREGTWEVGKDVKPGKYKTKGPVASAIPLCYWHVMEDGQIMAQGVKDKVGAQGIVTLNKGETFETNGCEPWYASK